MPPDRPDTATEMSRPRGRREPSPLEQIPVWDGFVSDAPVEEISGDPPAGLDALLGGLNPEQLKAVTHGEGPLLVVAGAGTGKTQVITRRIAWLIATRRARPSEILALTFTEKAAAEMQARVDQLVPYGYTDASIGTFHAFGDRVIREYALELGLPTDVRVLTRPEVVIFLREHLFEFELDEYRPLGDPTRFLGALATLFSRCKDEDVSPEAYLAHADELAIRSGADPDDEAVAEDARRHGELARAYARYQELLAAAGFIDFGDQVSLALRLVRTSAAARAELRSRFRYVLVDEFQDTNRAQSELVSILAEPHRNITVVGDDDQSIYKFRGAAISNILGFRDRYRSARTVVLRRNYRSLAPILDASYRLVRCNDPDRLEVRAGISKQLRAVRAAPDEAPVRLEAFATHGEEADWIAAEIGRRVAAGARPRDHAVLVRANGHADPILRSLNVAGIPWRFSGTSGLYARPEVRRLLAFLRAVADPGSSVDVYAVATAEPYGLGGEDLTAIVNLARRRHRSVWDVLEELERQPGILRVSEATRAGVARLVGDLRRYIQLAHERPAGEVLFTFLKDSGALGRLAASDSVAAEEELRNVARFFDIVRGQSTLLADDRAVFVARHLDTLIEAGDDPPTADLDPDADAVAVLTVHKAKGLEFPFVFMPGLVAGRFPTHSRREPLSIPLALVRETLPEGDFQLQEERRLFYVGMTRARDELVLSSAADYGGGIARRLSPFVLEALELPPQAAIPGAGVTASDPLDRIAAAQPVATGVAPVRGPRDEPLLLSFYAIDDYLSCPLKFKYGHVLRVPIAPHHALVYGSALHKAIQEFHRRHARGDVMSDEELFAAFQLAWTNEGFLTREHEEARLATGRESLRRFREEQLKPGAVIPAYVEREFSFSLDGDRIRGRWDRVDIEPADDGGDDQAPQAAAHADTVSPTLGLTGRERVTITDYKSSDVRDPAKARQRTRDSLQLQIYAMGYEALTGRLPDYLQLHFLDSGLVGRAPVDQARLAKARQKIATAAAGMRARDYTARPDRMTCTYCPYREICPSSAAT
jgi:DNA helicase-2/ATP-dependent DNA helicase PcrA